MYKFNDLSLGKLKTCDIRLQNVFNEVIKEIDCSIVCGYRGEKEQNEAFENGHSKLKFPHSNHNKYPSLAIDVIPYPTRYKKKDKFIELSKIVKDKANNMDIEIIWGGDWENFKDFPHYEVK